MREEGLPAQRDAVPPTPPRGPPLAATRGVVLRLARAARPSRIRHGDHVGSPGRGPNSAPARCHRPPGVWPPPAAFQGRPCPPPSPNSRSPITPEAGAPEVGEPAEGARKFCLEFGGCCGRGSPRCSSSSTPSNLTPSLPLKVRGLEGVPGTRWLSAPCTTAPAHLGRRPAGSGRPIRRGWAERARGLLRPPPGGPREGRRVSSSLPGGGERKESARRGRWGPGGLRPHSDPGPQSWVGGRPAPNFGERGAGRVGGIATERAGPRRRPHPAVGPRGGGRKAGSGGPAGSAFPPQVSRSGNDVLGAQQQKRAQPVPGSARAAVYQACMLLLPTFFLVLALPPSGCGAASPCTSSGLSFPFVQQKDGP